MPDLPKEQATNEPAPVRVTRSARIGGLVRRRLPAPVGMI